jgi:hypothetical protein
MFSGYKRIIGLAILAIGGGWQAIQGSLTPEQVGAGGAIIALITLLLHTIDVLVNKNSGGN